jgi:hypothetical protein
MIAFGFVHPAILWALPLAVVPIAIHLLNRRRFERRRWAAMTFLRSAIEKNRRRLRMEHWLVLLLRTIAIVLLVLLVARPILDATTTIGANRHHVVLLDDSASMQEKDGVGEVWSACRRAARGFVRDLARSEGDLVTVALASAPDRPLADAVPAAGSRAERLLEDLDALSVGDGGFAVPAALAALRARLRADGLDRPVQYHVFSDLRAADWCASERGLPTALHAWLSADGSRGPALTVHAVVDDTPKDAVNLALLDLVVVDPRVTIGVPSRFAARIANRGTIRQGPTRLTVEFDDGATFQRPVPALAPGEETRVEFERMFDRAGPIALRCTLPEDVYRPDDERSAVLRVDPHLSVLVVDGDLPGAGITPVRGEPSHSAGYFLRAALDPEGRTTTGIRPRVIPAGALRDERAKDLAEVDVLWLADVPAEPYLADADVLAALRGYLADGGGLVLSLGENATDVESWNRALADTGLAPARLLGLSGDARLARGAILDPDAPGPLRDAADALAPLFELQTGFGRWFRTETLEDSDGSSNSRVLIPLRVDAPERDPLLLVAESSTGGVRALWTSDIGSNDRWSNWSRTFAFLPTVHELVRACTRSDAPRRESLRLTPDDVLTVAIDPNVHTGDVVITARSDGSSRTFGAASGRRDLTVAMTALETSGIHVARRMRHDGGTDDVWFARNSEPDEGRLERAAIGALRDRVPPAFAERMRVISARPTSGLDDETSATATTEAWRVLAWALLIGLLLEPLLTAGFHRR